MIGVFEITKLLLTKIKNLNMKYSYLLAIILILFFFTACQNEIEKYQLSTEDDQYFPLKLGEVRTYKLDSTIFDNKGTIKTKISRIVKENVIESYFDDEGEANFIIEQNIFDSNKLVLTNILNAYKNKTKVVRNEGNLKFIKLVFPVIKDKSWDGNALFDAENTIVRIAGEPIKMYELWDYRYDETGISKTLNGNEYKNVVSVIQTDTENSIEKRYSLEQYAKGVGLIYKKMMILNTQKIDLINTPWELKAEEGFILEQQLISFDK
jgi:hypothetical protein